MKLGDLPHQMGMPVGSDKLRMGSFGGGVVCGVSL